eukprot:TRINITY_DN1976_c0_g1_i1.p1 TRINITY_DN1976_c0_g1~~TRINITY_DN1976_c0_g1_i1.p1  ORF type:complete len:378 (+),score=92.52 TRINITY_DN1976_c0_g1_i1:34-1134(+)
MSDGDAGVESSPSYEDIRKMNIERNRAMFQQLGLDVLPPVLEAPKKPQRTYTPKRARTDPSEPLRRSRRHSLPADGASTEDGQDQADSQDLQYLTGKRRVNPGKRIVGGRVYDSENGTTCHQCRQKTMNPKVTCTNVIVDWQGKERPCGLMLDEMCLIGRYGQTLDEVMNTGEWKCPKCLDICNCSFCRRNKGRAATGALKSLAKQKGYSSAAHYLNSIEIANQSLMIAAPAPVRPDERPAIIFHIDDESEQEEQAQSQESNEGANDDEEDGGEGEETDTEEGTDAHDGMVGGSQTKEGNESEFVVERIIASRYATTQRGKGAPRLYLVKWEGFDDMTWEPAESFSDPSYIEEFTKNKKNAKRHKR